MESAAARVKAASAALAGNEKKKPARAKPAASKRAKAVKSKAPAGKASEG